MEKQLRQHHVTTRTKASYLRLSTPLAGLRDHATILFELLCRDLAIIHRASAIFSGHGGEERHKIVWVGEHILRCRSAGEERIIGLENSKVKTQ